METIDSLNKLKEDFYFNICKNNETKAIELAHELADSYDDKYVQGFLGGYYKNKDIDKAIKYFKMAAKQGNIKCINELSVIYYLKKDAQSIEELVKLTEKFNHNYIFFLKVCIAIIHGVDKEVDDVVNETIEYNSTEINIILRYALNYYEKKENFKKAFKLLKLMEKYYERTSYYKIAKYYKEGKGVEKDLNKCFEYLLIANDANSNIELGNIFINGEGVKVDYERAVTHYINAYKKGNKVVPLYIARIFDDKSISLYNPKTRDKWLEEFFKINANNARTIDRVRNFVAEVEGAPKENIKKLMKKYWKIEDFEA